MTQKIIGSTQPVSAVERATLGLSSILHIDSTPVVPVGSTAPDWYWGRIIRQHHCSVAIGDGYRILRPNAQPWCFISYPTDQAADVPTPLREIGIYYWGNPTDDHIRHGLELIQERIRMYL